MTVSCAVIGLGLVMLAAATALLWRDCVRDYGYTIGGEMMFSHLWILGSLVLSGGICWAAGISLWFCLIGAAALYALSMPYRRAIDRLGRRHGRLPTDRGEEGSPRDNGHTPGEPVDKDSWQPCQFCGKSTPVVRDHYFDEGVLRERDTVTYVCPHCRQSHVGTQVTDEAIVSQRACHECNTPLGDAYQCPRCQFPRGWATAQCPYCDNKQPAYHPHLTIACNLHTLDCVKCGRRHVSACIC